MTDRAHLDIDLINRYLSGDLEAFNEIMEAHEDRVFAICLRMLRNRDSALDATQDTFLTLFRKADRYKATAAFSTPRRWPTVWSTASCIRRAGRWRGRYACASISPPG